MIKKQQKWIALLVTITFVWLLQVSSMPLAAAGSTEQISSANAEQGPDFVEAVGHNVAPVKKKSILPIVLISVGVVAVAAVLFLVVLKTKYDIVGSWNFKFTGPYSSSQSITFTGTKASGNFVSADNANVVGTYTVDGKNVVFLLPDRPNVQFSGQFTAKDTITGTWIDEWGTWNFTATRSTATATSQPTPAAQANLFTK